MNGQHSACAHDGQHAVIKQDFAALRLAIHAHAKQIAALRSLYIIGDEGSPVEGCANLTEVATQDFLNRQD